MVWALKTARQYVILAKVEIFSDCLTAIAALRKGEGSKRIMKWFVEMSQYSYTLTYKPGRLNNDADCLSRPFSGTAREETPTVSVINASDDPKRVLSGKKAIMTMTMVLGCLTSTSMKNI